MVYRASINFVPPSKVRKEGFWDIVSASSEPSCESDGACSIEMGDEGTRCEVEILTGVTETVEMVQLGARCAE